MKLLLMLLTNPLLFAKKVANRFIRFYRLYVQKDEFTVEMTRWFSDKGDETLRLDYPKLNEESIVFDLGGFKGDFAQAI